MVFIASMHLIGYEPTAVSFETRKFLTPLVIAKYMSVISALEGLGFDIILFRTSVA